MILKRFLRTSILYLFMAIITAIAQPIYSIEEGPNGMAYHETTVCNVHPFIITFQENLSYLLAEDSLQCEINNINVKGTFSKTAYISWIAADYTIHSILPLGFEKANLPKFLKILKNIKPIVNTKQVIMADSSLSKIYNEVSLIKDSSKNQDHIDSDLLLTAIYNIIEMLEPFCKPEIKRDIDQYEDAIVEDTCFSWDGLFSPHNPVIECTESLIQLGVDSDKLIKKDKALLKILIHAARERK